MLGMMSRIMVGGSVVGNPRRAGVSSRSVVDDGASSRVVDVVHLGVHVKGVNCKGVGCWLSGCYR